MAGKATDALLVKVETVCCIIPGKETFMKNTSRGKDSDGGVIDEGCECRDYGFLLGEVMTCSYMSSHGIRKLRRPRIEAKG